MPLRIREPTSFRNELHWYTTYGVADQVVNLFSVPRIRVF